MSSLPLVQITPSSDDKPQILYSGRDSPTPPVAPPVELSPVLPPPPANGAAQVYVRQEYSQGYLLTHAIANQNIHKFVIYNLPLVLC